MTSVKILTAYHKPAKIPKKDIFVPIHVGRAGEKNKMSEADYLWMLDHMIGDDTGENISDLNYTFCEMTGVYWAWKNYDQLGNPDYIGLNHYRRFFDQKDIEIALKKDITVAVLYLEKKSNPVQQFYDCHHAKYLEDILDDLERKKEWKKAVQIFRKSKVLYAFNIFLMKKELFFEYCEFVFPILLEKHKTINYEDLSAYNQRMMGFIAERLTSLFFIRKKLEKVSTHECELIFVENTKLDSGLYCEITSQKEELIPFCGLKIFVYKFLYFMPFPQKIRKKIKEKFKSLRRYKRLHGMRRCFAND